MHYKKMLGGGKKKKKLEASTLVAGKAVRVVSISYPSSLDKNHL